MAAIEREKQLKRWVRRKKVALIDESNPEWKDLSDLLPPSS
jgi:putative endonuclease